MRESFGEIRVCYGTARGSSTEKNEHKREAYAGMMPTGRSFSMGHAKGQVPRLVSPVRSHPLKGEIPHQEHAS